MSSIAMGAKVVVYFASDVARLSWHDAVMMAVHDDVNAPSVISASWGGAEEGWSYGGIEAVKALFQDAAMMGVTVLASLPASPCRMNTMVGTETPPALPDRHAFSGYPDLCRVSASQRAVQLMCQRFEQGLFEPKSQLKQERDDRKDGRRRCQKGTGEDPCYVEKPIRYEGCSEA